MIQKTEGEILKNLQKHNCVCFNEMINENENENEKWVKIWNKIEKSSTTGQEMKGFVSIFACILTAIPRV